MPDPIAEHGATAGAGLAPQPVGMDPGRQAAPPPDVDAERTEFGTEARSQFRMVLRRFVRHKLAMVSAFVLIVATLFAFLVPVFNGQKYDEQSRDRSAEPSSEHWFGTDQLGRDVFTRVMRGTTKTMQVGVLAAVFATAVGVIVGALAGYYRGWIDALLMRITDLFLSIPLIAVLIVAANRFRSEDRGFLQIAFIIAAFAWMYQARLTRSEFLALREREFVQSARALGASDRRIIVRHLLPNAIGAIIVNATLTIATAILIEATLAFLGFGISPPDVSLGSLIDAGSQAARTRWWLFYPPGIWLVLLLLCVNFLGDGLRDAIDPTKERVRA
jgi:peptide/nickel transport system permease protein